MLKKLSIAALLLAAAAAGFLLRQDLQRTDLAAINSADVSGTRVAFALPDMAGTVRDFSEWDGKARIVNFWATWCAPCRREIPLLKQTQSAHADSGLQVLGIAVDFVEDVITYAEEADFNYPILVGQEDAMAAAESSGVAFIGLPFTMIVARSGELLGVHMGEIHPPQMQIIVDQLAALDSGETSFAEARERLKEL